MASTHCLDFRAMRYDDSVLPWQRVKDVPAGKRTSET